MSRPAGVPNLSKLNAPLAWQVLWMVTEPMRHAARRTWAQRLATMTPERLAEYKAKRNAYGRARRAAKLSLVKSYVPSRVPDALDGIVNEVKTDRAARPAAKW